MRTIASIRERIFAPLERAGAQVDVFFHTYTLAKVSSAWAREVDAVVGGPNQELKLLDEGKHRVVEWSATNQPLFDKETNYTAYYALRGGGYSEPVLRNEVRAMNSLKLVTELWMATASTHARHAPGGDIPLEKAAVDSPKLLNLERCWARRVGTIAVAVVEDIKRLSWRGQRR